MTATISASIRRRFCFRLSVRLHSVRAVDHALRRRTRHPQDRFGQYRRDQCAAHRPPHARRGDASRDILKGTLAVVLTQAVLGRDFAIVAGSAPFSAMCFRSGSVFAAAKGVATISAFSSVCRGGSPRLLRDLGRGRRDQPLLVACGLVASAITPLILWWRGQVLEAEVFLLLTVLLWIMHRGNIVRLSQG